MQFLNINNLFTILFYFSFFFLDVLPIIDCEIDDDSDVPDYSSKKKIMIMIK